MFGEILEAKKKLAKPAGAMLVTFSTVDGRTEQMDLLASSDLGEVKGLVEALLGVPSANQMLVMDGRRLPTQGTLGAAGVGENALVVVMDAVRMKLGLDLYDVFFFFFLAYA